MRIGLFRRRIAHNNHLFTAQYIDPKALFAFCFGQLPNISYITEVDVNAAYSFIYQRVGADIQECLQHAAYNRDAGQMEFNVSFLVLSDNRLIEVGSDYVTVFHSGGQNKWAAALMKEVARFRVQESVKGPIGFSTRQAASN